MWLLVVVVAVLDDLIFAIAGHAALGEGLVPINLNVGTQVG